MTTFWQMTAAEIAARVKRRTASAGEVCRDALARLEAVNPSINAVVDYRPDDALAQAAAIDAKLAAGDDVGPLTGVPVTIKIITDQSGFATTNGVRMQRDVVAADDNPVVDNLRKAGAVVIGRTNTPAFSYRWFTSNQLYGRTINPHDPAITPGGSSGGAATAVATGIGAIAQGTDIAGSVRFPAYACGVHGLRPTLGRIAGYNATSPERSIGSQLMSTSGPLARSIGDIRLALDAMSQPDPRDPWWMPVPLRGPPVPKRAALCLRPDGLAIVPEVEGALIEAAGRLRQAGWEVAQIDDVPPMEETVRLHLALWLGDGYDAKLRDAEQEGDPGALAVLRNVAQLLDRVDLAAFSAALTRRATLIRQWQLFLATYPVVLLPVCGALPFPDDADLAGAEAFQQVVRAQLTQIAIPFLGLPGLTVATGRVGSIPVGVQVMAGRYREDLCLDAGDAIAGVPIAPIDPRAA